MILRMRALTFLKGTIHYAVPNSQWRVSCLTLPLPLPLLLSLKAFTVLYLM
jgi:hypothetical protein